MIEQVVRFREGRKLGLGLDFVDNKIRIIGVVSISFNPPKYRPCKHNSFDVNESYPPTQPVAMYSRQRAIAIRIAKASRSPIAVPFLPVIHSLISPSVYDSPRMDGWMVAKCEREPVGPSSYFLPLSSGNSEINATQLIRMYGFYETRI